MVVSWVVADGALNAQNQVVARYVYASQEHVPDYLIQNGTTYRLVTDQLGSVRLVVNAETGAVAQRLDYDVWGNVVTDTAQGFQPFGFAGGLYDPLTGLVRFGARDYDPQVGRWTSKDPMGFASEDTNLYAYVSNDPVNGIDPSGLFLNVVAGCLISGGIELAAQMIMEGRSLGCVDWPSVALETLMGCNPFAKGLKAGKAAKGLKCAGNSLVAGTLVHTEQGLVPIELVKVGERVLSWDERTGERSEQPVMELIQHEGMYELVKVTLESGEQLEATSGHPFYIQGKGWNAAANLKVGDALLLYNGTTLVVKTVDSRVGWERVYNFAVAGNANYFVGSGGVGVHNCPLRRSDHAKLRSSQGRNVSEAYRDLQNAKDSDIFVQDDGRFVIRGANGREHIIEPDGEIVTSIKRPNKAHLNLVGNKRFHASQEDLVRVRSFLGN